MEKEIRTILAAWNPIDVPEFIAEDEYKNYASVIAEKCKSFEDVQIYLQRVFVEDFGYDLTEEADLDIKNVSEKILKVIK